jgi:hypothetical protein
VGYGLTDQWSAARNPGFKFGGRVQRPVPAMALSLGHRWHHRLSFPRVGPVAAVDEYDQVVDVYVLLRRDRTAVRLFFDGCLVIAVVAPVEVVTDQGGS